MTEAEWLECTDPQKMLMFLRGKASERKLRLFACAVARRVWSLIPDEDDRKAVELTELYMDGLVPVEQWRENVGWVMITGQGEEEGPMEVLRDGEYPTFWWNEEGVTVAHGLAVDTARFAVRAMGKASRATVPDTVEENASVYENAHAVREAMWEVIRNLATDTPTREAAYRSIADAEGASRAEHERVRSIREAALTVSREAATAAERIAQAALIRDIFMNRFQPVTASSSWLAWNDSTVVKIAQSIYDDCAFDRLPTLADALEESGCDNADILAHCRSEGEHVRGCWVVDLLLGKE